MADIYEDIIAAQSEIIKTNEKQGSFKNLISINFKEENLQLSEENENEKYSLLCMQRDVKSFDDNINELFHLKEQFIKLRRNFLLHRISECSPEIMNYDENDQRFKHCKEISSHLHKIVEYKNLISWYLQQPLVNNFLKVHHSHIGNLKELLDKIVEILLDFEFYTQSLNRIHDLNLEQSENHIFRLTQLLDSIRTTMKNVNTLSFINSSS